MSYRLKEVFHTLQGEGLNAGRSAVFARFSGCNLWSGREEHRETAVCQFCDTDFVGTDGPGGGVFSDAEAFARAVRKCWDEAAAVGSTTARGAGGAERSAIGLVVCTGGEPLLQLDSRAIRALHSQHMEIAIETNGTIPLPDFSASGERGIDWVCVSPKTGSEVVVRSGDELKLIYPQAGSEPEMFEDWDFEHFLLQPMDGPALAENSSLAVAYCKAHPLWRLSVQTHKYLGIP